MKQTGVLFLGHADYLDENAAAIRAEISRALSPTGQFDLSASEVAVTDSQAIGAARELLHKGCAGAVLVLSTWVECNIVMSALKELRGLPMLFWGFPLEQVNGRRESTGSYVSASMFAGTVRRLKLPAEILIGSWNEPSVLERLSAFASAANAVDRLFYSKIGLIGYTSMSIYTGTFDHVLLRYLVGPEVQQMDAYSLIRLAESSTEEELADARRRLEERTCICADVQPPVLKKTLALYAAMKKLCADNGWGAINVKCQYEFSKEYRVVPCVALSLLAEEGIVASCEGDMLCTVSMLILNSLTAQPVTYGDSLTHHGNVVQFSPCGFMPFSMGADGVRVQKFMEHPGFSGIQVSGVLRPEKVTFLRLVEDIGTYHFVYGTGNGLKTEPRGGCMPALDVELDGSIEALCREYAGQHYALAYGDLSGQIEVLSRITGIPAIRI